MPRAAGKDIEEIFGYAPDDLSSIARTCWNLKACPFVGKGCIKYNHDKTICYGTCSISECNKSVCINPKCSKRYTIVIVTEANISYVIIVIII